MRTNLCAQSALRGASWVIKIPFDVFSIKTWARLAPVLVIIGIPGGLATLGAIPVHIGEAGIENKTITKGSVASVVGRGAALKSAVVCAASNFG
jgi:hypothetical protein